MEGDKDGEPRILLYGSGPYSFLESYLLQIDCQTNDGKLELELYAREITVIPLPIFLEVRDQKVAFSIDGEEGPIRHWSFQSDDDSEVVFAPDGTRDAIIAALLDGAQKLEVTVNPDKDYAATYTFFTRGFKEASKPVIDYCNR